MEKESKKRFVLVHGLCHGAWTWYKVKTQLVAVGHSVTAVDLAASGINMTRLEEIQTLKDYARPLLDTLSSVEDKVILVAHSMGRIPISLAADIFPRKIAAIVFLTAFMPDTSNTPSYVYEKLIRSVLQEDWLDTVFGTYGKPDLPLEWLFLDQTLWPRTTYISSLRQKYDLKLSRNLYFQSSVDCCCGMLGSYIGEYYGEGKPLSYRLSGRDKKLSEEGYGSVTRIIYILCGKDLAVPEDYQRWMINNFPVNEVMEIKDAYHMAMFSKPRELCALLLEISDNMPK
ncbi:hypothetical protein Bca4012_009980 [Brassica carinata]